MRFDIPSTSLPSALALFVAVSDVQIIYQPGLTPKRPTLALHGSYTTDQALEILLDSNGLDFHRTTSGVIVITAPAAKPPLAPPPAVRSMADPVTVKTPPLYLGPSVLDEVVVTAGRMTELADRTPMSLSVLDQARLDEQTLRSFTEVARTISGSTVSGQQAGVQTISIRGIFSAQGAPTTGFYLDDTPLQKRNVAGASGQSSANGTPGPLLFDLERVEVLRGPQGTLYGSGSEGGTVKLITPTPSLVRYSGMAKTGAWTTEGGAVSYETTAAVGGPLVRDKLGLRLSVYDRHTGGYVDYVDPYRSGATRYRDANSGDARAVRGSLLFAPTDKLKINLFGYSSVEADTAGANAYTILAPGVGPQQTLTTPSSCYADSLNPASCTTGTYLRSAQTYGPFPYLGGAFNNINLEKSPSKTELNVASVTINATLGPTQLKAITSYFADVTKNLTYEVGQVTPAQKLAGYGDGVGFPLFSPLPNYPGRFSQANRRDGVVQEARLSSGEGARPLSWVAGVYFSSIRAKPQYVLTIDLESIARALYGVSALQRYGQPELPNRLGTARQQDILDTEAAIFGEGRYSIGDRWRIIAGLRLSRIAFDYRQVYYGPITGWNTPTESNGGIILTNQVETPLTPKFGVEYQVTDRDLIYATASKGFRAGGPNSTLTGVGCAQGLANLGLTLADIPKRYASDAVWSYELGGKARTEDRRLQISSSAFYIDWRNVQLNVTVPGCLQSYGQNVGLAHSWGFDFEMRARLFSRLTLNASAGYTNAAYAQTAYGPKPLAGAATPIVLQGDRLPIPEWEAAVGARYEFPLRGTLAYVRLDYQYSSAYHRSGAAGTATYAPDVYLAQATNFASLRLGDQIGKVAAAIYVNNLFDSNDVLSAAGGRTGCALTSGAACQSYAFFTPFLTVTSFRPRQIGVELSYAF